MQREFSSAPVNNYNFAYEISTFLFFSDIESMKVKKTDLPVLPPEQDILPSLDDEEDDSQSIDEDDDDDDDIEDEEDMMADEAVESDDDDDYDDDSDGNDDCIEINNGDALEYIKIFFRFVEVDESEQEDEDTWNRLSTKSAKESATTSSTISKTTEQTVSMGSSVASAVDPYFTHFDPRAEHQSYKVKFA